MDSGSGSGLQDLFCGEEMGDSKDSFFNIFSPSNPVDEMVVVYQNNENNEFEQNLQNNQQIHSMTIVFPTPTQQQSESEWDNESQLVNVENDDDENVNNTTDSTAQLQPDNQMPQMKFMLTEEEAGSVLYQCIPIPFTPEDLPALLAALPATPAGPPPPPPPPPSQDIIQKFYTEQRQQLGASLLALEALSDTILESEGQQIHCHKVVLAAKSQFFADMFINSNNEDHRHLQIENLSFATLRLVVNLIYAAEPIPEKITVAVALNLLEAAESYGIPSIRELAVGVLREEPPETFPVCLVPDCFAFCLPQSGVDDLIEKCVYIFKTRRRGESYVKTREWQIRLMQQPKLAIDLLTRVCHLSHLSTDNN